MMSFASRPRGGDKSRAVKCQSRVYDEREVEVAQDPFREASCGDEAEVLPEVAAELGHDLADHPAVSDERAEAHRALGGAADLRGAASADLHSRQLRRPLEEVVAHQREPGRYHAAAPDAVARHDRRGERRAEVHDDQRRAVARHRARGVRKPVRADRLGVWIVDGDRLFPSRRLEAEVGHLAELESCLLREGAPQAVRLRDDGDVGKRGDALSGGDLPDRGGSLGETSVAVRDAGDASVGPKPDGGRGVADIDYRELHSQSLSCWLQNVLTYPSSEAALARLSAATQSLRRSGALGHFGHITSCVTAAICVSATGSPA